MDSTLRAESLPSQQLINHTSININISINILRNSSSFPRGFPGREALEDPGEKQGKGKPREGGTWLQRSHGEATHGVVGAVPFLECYEPAALTAGKTIGIWDY